MLLNVDTSWKWIIVKQIGYRKRITWILNWFLSISLIDKIYNLPLLKYDKLEGR